MIYDQEVLMKLWERQFGTSKDAIDFADRPIHFDDYNSRGYYQQGIDGEYRDYGWNIHHIMPVSLGGKDDITNMAVVHWMTNAEAGNKITFSANGQVFQVKRIKFESIYGIFRLGDNQRVV